MSKIQDTPNENEQELYLDGLMILPDDTMKMMYHDGERLVELFMHVGDTGVPTKVGIGTLSYAGRFMIVTLMKRVELETFNPDMVLEMGISFYSRPKFMFWASIDCNHLLNKNANFFTHRETKQELQEVKKKFGNHDLFGICHGCNLVTGFSPHSILYDDAFFGPILSQVNVH